MVPPGQWSPAGFLLVRGTRRGPAGVDLVAVVPGKGVVLLEMAPRWTDAAVQRLRHCLDESGFTKAYPGCLPIAHRLFGEVDAYHLEPLIEQALSLEPPLTIPADLPWEEEVARLVHPAGLAPAPRPGAAPRIEKDPAADARPILVAAAPEASPTMVEREEQPIAAPAPPARSRGMALPIVAVLLIAGGGGLYAATRGTPLLQEGQQQGTALLAAGWTALTDTVLRRPAPAAGPEEAAMPPDPAAPLPPPAVFAALSEPVRSDAVPGPEPVPASVAIPAAEEAPPAAPLPVQAVKRAAPAEADRPAPKAKLSAPPDLVPDAPARATAPEPPARAEPEPAAALPVEPLPEEPALAELPPPPAAAPMEPLPEEPALAEAPEPAPPAQEAAQPVEPLPEQPALAEIPPAPREVARPALPMERLPEEPALVERPAAPAPPPAEPIPEEPALAEVPHPPVPAPEAPAAPAVTATPAPVPASAAAPAPVTAPAPAVTAAPAAPPAPTAAPPPPLATAPRMAPPPREEAARPAPPAAVAPEVVALMLRRGQGLLEQGDISGARRFLQRAAQAGSAPAALLLAETHDPRFLEARGARGLQPDAAQALRWYRHAAELGATDAAPRIRELESQTR